MYIDGLEMKMTLLLDHANVPFQRLTLRDLLESWFDSIGLPAALAMVDVKLRAYGGWYEGNSASRSRFQAAKFYQSHCPTLFRYKRCLVKTTFEFADYVLPCTDGVGEVEVPIRHSVVSRGSASYVKLKPGALDCTEANCQLASVRRWARKRKACLNSACPKSFQDCFERTEQKQVDVHLALDLLTLAERSVNGEHIGIATDDADLLPVLVGGAHRTARSGAILSQLRCQTGRTYMDSTLESLKVFIAQVSERVC